MVIALKPLLNLKQKIKNVFGSILIIGKKISAPY